MRNPWTAKNPFMSMWLSSANRAAGAARGVATATAKRQLATLQGEAAKQMIDFWTGKTLMQSSRTRKRR